MNFKKGTPGFGMMLGLIFAGLGALVMAIGFWKALLLAALFALGYFLGSVDDKGAFFRNTANRIIPEKNSQAIDLKSEILREQEQAQRRMQASEQLAQASAEASEQEAEE